MGYGAILAAAPPSFRIPATSFTNGIFVKIDAFFMIGAIKLATNSPLPDELNVPGCLLEIKRSSLIACLA